MKSNQTLALLTLLLFTFFNYNSVAQDNEPPTLINPIEDKIIKEDQHFNFNLKLNEVFSDESPLTFSLDLGHADWLANVGDSVLVGFPLEEHIGEFVIEVKAADASGNSSSTSFSINVTSEDDKPIVIKNLPGQLQRPGFGEIKIGYKDLFYDEEDESLSYNVRSSYPAVVTASIIGDSIVITEKGIGPAEIILTATDSKGNQAETKMFIRVFEDPEILNMTTANTGSNGLSNSNVRYIRNDYSGNTWATTFLGEINKYNNGKWEQSDIEYPYEVGEIWNDNEGNTYFFRSDCYAIKYDGETFSTVKFPFPFDHIGHTWISNDSILYLAGYSFLSNYDFSIIKNTTSGWEKLYFENGDTLIQGIHQMCVDVFNNVWLTTEKGLEQVKNGSRTVISDDYDLNEYVYSMTPDTYGNIWFNTQTRVYEYNTKKNTLHQHTVTGPVCLYADNIGNIWIGRRNEVVRIRDGVLTHHRLKDPISMELTYHGENAISKIYKTNDGRYWFCSEYGLFIAENYLLKDESMVVQHTFDGLASNDIYDIQRDSEGIYFFKARVGVSRYDGRNWEYMGRAFEFHFLDAENRKLYAGDHRGGLVVIDQNNEQTVYPEYVTQCGGINDIVKDKFNNIWLAGSKGLVKFDGTNWTQYTTGDGLPTNFINVLMADSNGNIWTGHNETENNGIIISKFDGTSFTNQDFYDDENEMVLLTLLEDKDGNIWAGGYNMGLKKYDGIKWNSYTTDNGLKSNIVQSLALDYFGGIWVSYCRAIGVSRFDGTKFDHFTTDDGLPTNNITKVYVDHALTNQNKNGSLNKSETKDLIWLGTGDKGTANFYLQTATSIVDHSLPEMKALIFPNPTQGITNIILDNQQRKYLDVEVLSLDGKMVYKKKTGSLTSKIQLNLSSYPPGTYLVTLKSDIDSVVKKIILN